MQAKAETILARWQPRRYRVRETGWQDCSRRITLGPLRPSPSAVLAGLTRVGSDAVTEVRSFSGYDLDAELMAVIEAGRTTLIEYKYVKNIRGWCSREIYHTEHFSQLLRSSGLDGTGGLDSSTEDSFGFVHALGGRLSAGGGERCFLFVAIQGKRRIDGYSCPATEAEMTASAIERFLARITL